MNRQQGVSLISLLIGLLVSSIVLVGMMMIFRNMIQTAVPASEAARSDGERVSGLLAAQMMLHDAGFGIASARTYGTHLQVWKNVAFTNGVPSGVSNAMALGELDGRAIGWVKNTDGGDRCEGLVADNEGGLWRISSNNVCSSVSSGITGTAMPLIRPSRHEDDAVAAIAIEARTGACRPFGIGSGISGNVTAKITVENSADRDPIESTTCLANFQ